MKKIRRPGLGWFLAVAVILLPAGAARAQTACAGVDVLAQELSSRYGEAPVGQGVMQGVRQGGQLLRLFVARTGTWTVLVVLPDGRACVAAHGDGWHPVAKPAHVAEPAGFTGVPHVPSAPNRMSR